MTMFAASLEECHRLGVFTQEQALRHLASKMRQKKFFGGPKKSPIEDARDMLVNTVLAHVPVENFDFKMKALYLALMVRRVIEAGTCASTVFTSMSRASSMGDFLGPPKNFF